MRAQILQVDLCPLGGQRFYHGCGVKPFAMRSPPEAEWWGRLLGDAWCSHAIGRRQFELPPAVRKCGGEEALMGARL